jgi:hypothetical protein
MSITPDSIVGIDTTLFLEALDMRVLGRGMTNMFAACLQELQGFHLASHGG